MRKAIPVITGVVGFSAGGALGYILARRQGRQELIELTQALDNHVMAQQREINILRDELDKTRIRIDKEIGPLDIPLEREIDYTQFVEGANESAYPVPVTSPSEPVTKNIFDGNDDEWDYEAEQNIRSNKTIYVIHKDEFIPDEMGYRQSTVTWYEGDQILADERDAPIYNWSSIVGTELPFGHGSEDPNVVYIRNEDLRHEYEVLRDPGRFDVEVEGHQIEQGYEEQELKHSRAPLKFRQE